MRKVLKRRQRVNEQERLIACNKLSIRLNLMALRCLEDFATNHSPPGCLFWWVYASSTLEFDFVWKVQFDRFSCYFPRFFVVVISIFYLQNGRVINSYYGSNAPELVKLIKTELELYKNGANEGRRTFALSEMNPLDIEHFAAKKMKLRLAKQAERTKETQKRRDYMQSVTDEIMMRCADMGVTAFMPHVSSGHLFDELLRVAKDLNLVPKERVTVRVSDSDFKIINFGGENLSTVLYSQMKGKDVFMICWKIPDNELRPTEGIRIFTPIFLSLSLSKSLNYYLPRQNCFWSFEKWS